MATTMEQRAKFRELRLWWTSRDEAMKTAYGNVAPVAPTPEVKPTPAPTTTTPLTPTQTMQGVNGETFQVAPTNAQWLSTPTQTPAPVQAQVTPPETTVASAVTPTPTPEIAPTPLDKTAEIKAKNEAQMALNKQKSELAIQDRKQAEADAKLASTPTDEKGVLNAFMTWASVPKQNTSAFRNAEFKYNNFKKFSTMTPTQLLDNMKMWEIGTETATLLAQNPNYIKAKEEFDKFQKSQSINNMMKSVTWGVTGKTDGLDYYWKAQSDVAKKLWVNETNAEAFARIVWGNELVQTLTKTVSDTAKQLNTLNTERNAVYADLKKQYPDMSASAIMTLMWTRTKETTDQINALNSTLTLTQADLKDAMTMAQAEYGATQADIALQADIAKEQRTIDNALALNQAEFDQKIAQQAQAMNDPVQAINSVIDQYAKEGIFAQKSAQQHIADAKALIAKWGTLGQYISQMQKDFQAKDSYKAKFTGNLNDTQKLLLQAQLSEKSDIRNFNQQKELARLNKDATREQFLFEIENDPEKRAKALELENKLNANKSLFDVLGKNVGTYEGNRGYDLAGKLGDPMPAGGNWKVESVIDANYQSSPYGNSVVMVDENWNKVRYSHLESIGVKPWDQLGFGDIVGTRWNTGNVKGASGETLTPEQLKAGRGAHLDVEIKDAKWNLLSQAQQVEWLKSKKANIKPTYDANALAIANGVGDLADLTATDKKTILPQIEAIVNSRMTDDVGRNAIIKSALYKKDISDSTLQKLTDMESVKWQLSSIESRLSKQSVWPILWALKKYNPYDTEAQVAMAELAGLTPKVARGIFGEVGVLTDTDIANYQKTLPNLTSTEEKNKFVIEFMRNLLARGVMKTIETQAKWQRNMSAFIEDYDNAKKYIEKGASTPSNEDENDWNDASNL